MTWVRSIRSTIVGAIAGLAVARAATAQSSATAPASAPPQSSAPAPASTRAQLVAMMRAADSSGRKEEAFELRTRLQDGDFLPGDQLTITYQGLVLNKQDAMVVATGPTLRLPEPMGDLNLHGMLRFELQDSVSARVAKYYRNTVVRVNILLRLSITGAVRNAGFFYVPPDAPLTDMIMRTGGQDASADLDNIVIRRGPQVIWHPEDVRAALADGVTFERLNLDPGDEIVVGAKKANHWLVGIQVGVTLLTLFVTLYSLTRR